MTSILILDIGSCMKKLIIIGIAFTNSLVSAVNYEGNYSPAFSPDEQYIAYHTNNETSFWEIVIENIKTGKKQQLTNNQFYDTSATWSPDSKKIAFSSSRTGKRDIYIYDLSTGQTSLIIDNPAMDNHPIWSPDGLSLAFLSRRDGNSQLYLYEFSSGKQIKLTDTEQAIFHPSWTRDGTQIVFDQKVDDRSAIFTVDVKSGKIKRIYKNQGSVISAQLFDNKLFVTTNINDNWDILAVDLNTGDESYLVKTSKDEMKVDISKNGRLFVYSQKDEKGIFQIVQAEFEHKN